MLLNFSLKKSIGHAINKSAEIYAHTTDSAMPAADWPTDDGNGNPTNKPGWDARAHAHFAFLILNKFVNK